MAKINLGKVVGDDGRGIVSIIKTATQGLVDTYTITYTDGTTSTFEVTNGSGGGGGTANYNELVNKPQINGIELTGNKSSSDLGIMTNTVSNLVNYYLKSETYTKQEVRDLISAIETMHYEVVEELPTVGESNIIYLTPKEESEENDFYDEYIYTNNTWEKIGGTQIDLSNYVTNQQLTQALNGKQDNLVSGTNIKTINGNSVLGSGNLVIEGGGEGLSSVAHDNTLTGDGTNANPLGVDSSKFQSPLVSGTNIKTINNTSILGSGNIDIEGGEGSEISATASALLVTILRNGVYSSNQATNISALQQALSGGDSDGYVISAILSNVTIDNDDIIVEKNSKYVANLTADSGYTLDSVTVTMGGLDITSTVYSNGKITIPTVSANVTIMATATENESGGFVYDPTKWIKDKGISVAEGGAIVDSANQDTYSEKIDFVKGSKLKVTASGSVGIYIYCWDEEDNFISSAGDIWLTESNNYTGEYVGNKNNMAKIMFTTNKGIRSDRVVSVEVE